MLLCRSCQGENDDVAQVCFPCRTILSAVTRGTVIGRRYEILSPLGRGGMGAVYRARDRVLDEVIALKLLRADIAGTSEMAERFRSEIRLARRVSHWNVCRIHEYGEDGPLQYISMELVEGTHLKALLQGGPLPTAQAFDVALQIVEGLQAIHKAGIVHRDLKSLNIMVDAHGVVRIMDFGIAKRLFREGASDPRASSYVMGTPEYMSPEQARGRKVDYRSGGAPFSPPAADSAPSAPRRTDGSRNRGDPLGAAHAPTRGTGSPGDAATGDGAADARHTPLDVTDGHGADEAVDGGTAPPLRSRAHALAVGAHRHAGG